MKRKSVDDCKTFKDWTLAWIDGSAWKNMSTADNPYANYVEIENYYVKALIGWRGTEGRSIDLGDYQRAVQILERFDVVMLTEWLKYNNQSDYVDAIYPHSSKYLTKKLSGKPVLKKKFGGILMADEVTQHIKYSTQCTDL